MRHQIMRQWSFFRHLAHEHCDRAPDRLIDVNDENLVAISDENRATATGWEYGANMYLNDRFVHRVTVPMEGGKTSCSQPCGRALPTFRITKRPPASVEGLFPLGPRVPYGPSHIALARPGAPL